MHRESKLLILHKPHDQASGLRLVKLGSNPILVNPKSHFQPGRLASLQLSTSPSVFPFLRQATALGSRHIHDIIMSAKDDEYFLRKTSSIILGDIAQMHLVS